MNISSKDIKKRDFKKSLRGYDANEVDAFLETVSSHYEKLVVENRSLQEKVKDLSADLEVYKENELTLQRAIVKSQDLSDEIVANAKNKAEVIVKEAELNARKMKQDIEDDIMSRRHELEEIKQRNERLIEDVKSFMNDKMSEFEEFLKERKIFKMELARTSDFKYENTEPETESFKQEIKVKRVSPGSGLETGGSFDDTFEVK
jgi:cell division initiation protein